MFMTEEIFSLDKNGLPDTKWTVVQQRGSVSHPVHQKGQPLLLDTQEAADAVCAQMIERCTPERLAAMPKWLAEVKLPRAYALTD